MAVIGEEPFELKIRYVKNSKSMLALSCAMFASHPTIWSLPFPDISSPFSTYAMLPCFSSAYYVISNNYDGGREVCYLFLHYHGSLITVGICFFQKAVEAIIQTAGRPLYSITLHMILRCFQTLIKGEEKSQTILYC